MEATKTAGQSELASCKLSKTTSKQTERQISSFFLDRKWSWWPRTRPKFETKLTAKGESPSFLDEGQKSQFYRWLFPRRTVAKKSSSPVSSEPELHHRQKPCQFDSEEDGDQIDQVAREFAALIRVNKLICFFGASFVFAVINIIIILIYLSSSGANRPTVNGLAWSNEQTQVGSKSSTYSSNNNNINIRRNNNNDRDNKSDLVDQKTRNFSQFDEQPTERLIEMTSDVKVALFCPTWLDTKLTHKLILSSLWIGLAALLLVDILVALTTLRLAYRISNQSSRPQSALAEGAITELTDEHRRKCPAFSKCRSSESSTSLASSSSLGSLTLDQLDGIKSGDHEGGSGQKISLPNDGLPGIDRIWKCCPCCPIRGSTLERLALTTGLIHLYLPFMMSFLLGAVGWPLVGRKCENQHEPESVDRPENSLSIEIFILAYLASYVGDSIMIVMPPVIATLVLLICTGHFRWLHLYFSLAGLSLGWFKSYQFCQLTNTRRIVGGASRLVEAKISLEHQRQQQETLLLSVLPAYVAEQVKRNMLRKTTSRPSAGQLPAVPTSCNSVLSGSTTPTAVVATPTGSELVQTTDATTNRSERVAGQLWQSPHHLQVNPNTSGCNLQPGNRSPSILLATTVAAPAFNQTNTGDISPLSSRPQHPAGHAGRRGFNELYIRSYNQASLLYGDIVGFTRLCSQLAPSHLVQVLNDLFSHFDKLAEMHRIMRIKILGDCYYGVSGIPEFAVLGAKSRSRSAASRQDNHALNCVNMGLDMIAYITSLHIEPSAGQQSQQQQPPSSLRLNMRVGVHTGHIHSGIIGDKKWQFDVWSNDVSIAMHCESSGKAGRVQVTGTTLSQLNGAFECEPVSDLDRNDAFLSGQDIKTFMVLQPRESHGGRPTRRRASRFVGSSASAGPPTGVGAASGTITKAESSTALHNDTRHIRAATIGTIRETLLGGGQPDEQLVSVGRLVGLAAGQPDLSVCGLEFRDPALRRNHATRGSRCGRTLSPPPVLSVGVHVEKARWIRRSLRLCGQFGRRHWPLVARLLVICLLVNQLQLALRAVLLAGVLRSVQPTSWSSVNQPESDAIQRQLTVIAILLALDLGGRPIGYKFKTAVLLGAASCELLLVGLVPAPPSSLSRPRWQSIFLLAAILCVVWVRQVEFAHRVDFIWRERLGVDHEELEYVAGINKVLLENILPSHLVQHYLSGQTGGPANLPHLASQYQPPYLHQPLVESAEGRQLYHEQHDGVAVMFASIPHFHEFYDESDISKQGLSCISLLNEIICEFDHLLLKNKFSRIEKIKTIGSTYMAAAGLKPPGSYHPSSVRKNKSSDGNQTTPTKQQTDSSPKSAHQRVSQSIDCDAIEPTREERRAASMSMSQEKMNLICLVQFASSLMAALDAINKQSFQVFKLRVGLNTGPVVAGVVGAQRPFYDIWGDCVNIASRMESLGEVGRIQVAERTALLMMESLAAATESYSIVKRGSIEVKGKGKMMTYFVDKKQPISSTTSNLSMMQMKSRGRGRRSSAGKLEADVSVGNFESDVASRRGRDLEGCEVRSRNKCDAVVGINGQNSSVDTRNGRLSHNLHLVDDGKQPTAV